MPGHRLDREKTVRLDGNNLGRKLGRGPSNSFTLDRSNHAFGGINTHVLRRHFQLVLTDRSTLTAGRDYGALSGRAWRLADLGAKHSMLLAGLGWGNMPSDLVPNDIAQGRLKVIRPVEFDSRVAQLAMCGVYLADHRLGPAGQWMINHLSAVVGS